MLGNARRLVVSGFTVFALSPSARADTLEAGDPRNLFEITDAVPDLEQPTSFDFLPDGRMLVTEKGGDLLLVDGGARRTIGSWSVDTGSEKGLLHVLVHPDFATNRLLILYYSAANDAGGSSTDRHRVVTVKLDGSDNVDKATETILVRGLRGPANHDGGALAIGQDGKLYVGVGDTGCNSGTAPEPVYTPTNFFATCLTLGNGKILRVNLDGSIPSDNPLVGKTVTACGDSCGDDVTALSPAPAREDIWAWGFRNPWRFWVDPKTGNLWVGDVGEVTYEEVNVIPPSGGGKHYGWPWREGAKGHPASKCTDIEPDVGSCVDPQYFCHHGGAEGNVDGDCASIIGGVIVDSCQFPAAFRGKYFFGDSAQGWLATLDPTADRSGIVGGSRKVFIDSVAQPVDIGVGPDGALYYSVIGGSGQSVIERVFPKDPEVCPPPSGSGGASGRGGSSGSGGGATASSGGSTSGGPADASDPDGSVSGGEGGSRDDSGCGCRVVADQGREARSLAGPAFAVLGAAWSLRRRRNARRTSRPRR